MAFVGLFGIGYGHDYGNTMLMLDAFVVCGIGVVGSILTLVAASDYV